MSITIEAAIAANIDTGVPVRVLSQSDTVACLEIEECGVLFSVRLSIEPNGSLRDASDDAFALFASEAAYRRHLLG